MVPGAKERVEKRAREERQKTRENLSKDSFTVTHGHAEEPSLKPVHVLQRHEEILNVLCRIEARLAQKALVDLTRILAL